MNKVHTKHWYPIKEIEDVLIDNCITNNYKKILEIGPGNVPFKLANLFIGYNEKIKNYISIDIDEQKLPFGDKEIDFIYSRHTLEDIQNPNFCMSEIIRCCNSGYIETPSPLIEITKGVDSDINSNLYSGYIHHRYIIWSDIEKCEIYFLPKYGSLIDNILQILNEEEHYKIVNNFPLYWNNYFIWKDKKPKIITYKNGINFDLTPTSYSKLVSEAVNMSIKNTEYFCKNYLNKFLLQ